MIKAGGGRWGGGRVPLGLMRKEGGGVIGGWSNGRHGEVAGIYFFR